MSGHKHKVRTVIMSPICGVLTLQSLILSIDMKRYAWTLPLLLALFLIPTTAQAQTSLSIGAKGGIDLGDVEEPYIGADVRIGFGDAPIRINPFFNYYFAPEDVTFWSAGANALYDFEIEDSAFSPYVGAGALILRRSFESSFQGGGGGNVSVSVSSSSSDIGLNGIAGTEFDLDSGIRPFVQAEVGVVFNEFDNATLLGISGGVLFDL